MTEAAIRRWLQRQCVVVHPNENVIGANQAPDFVCWSNGLKFYVEVKCISIAKATRETGIHEEPLGKPFTYRLLTGAIRAACKGKAPQCGNIDAPTLVAIATFHTFAAMLCFGKVKIGMVLTGTASFSWEIDVTSGKAVGGTRHTADPRSSAFLECDRMRDIIFARRSVSGLLFCGAGIGTAIGVLHPDPSRPFNPFALPTIDFGAIEVDRDSGRVRVRWRAIE